LIELPRPFLTRARLRGILTTQPGERVLEIGPGTGYYSLRVAEWLRPGGTLYVLDIQQQMLDHLMRRAKERGVENIVPTTADARDLPYPDDNFDAAYLTLVLGEIPDQDAALSELRRVLKPGGHLVVGEMFPDFHMVTFRTLQKRAEAVGFRFERRLGSALGYFARFRVL
jgi:ubiquinone/menaquinone biosynthesis C-methylase UbiE